MTTGAVEPVGIGVTVSSGDIAVLGFIDPVDGAGRTNSTEDVATRLPDGVGSPVDIDSIGFHRQKVQVRLISQRTYQLLGLDFQMLCVGWVPQQCCISQSQMVQVRLIPQRTC